MSNVLKYICFYCIYWNIDLFNLPKWHHPFNGHELGQTLGDGEGLRPSMLQSVGLQRFRHNLETEQQQQNIVILLIVILCWDFPGGPVNNAPSNAGGKDSTPGQGTGIWQLNPHSGAWAPQQKILYATMKTQGSQINNNNNNTLGLGVRNQ